MLEVKMATAKDLVFIKNTYKLLDITMTNLIKQLMDIDDEEEEEQHSDQYWMNLIQEKTGYIFIAFQVGNPIGMAVIEKVDEKEVHLEDLLVWPDFRKHGVGELLVKEAKDYVSKKGYKKMSLNVLSNNENGRKLYEKQGFKDVKIAMVCSL